MLAAIFARIKGYAAVVIGGAIFLTFAYFRARQDGKNAAMLERVKRQAEAINRKKETDDEVDRMGADRRRDELSRWMRDK